VEQHIMFKKSLITFIFLLVAAIVGVYMYFDAIIKHSIETYGSQAINSRISVGNVSTSLKDGLVSISGVKIANPAGFKERNVFELDNISVSMDIKSLFSKLINIHYVHINSPVIIYELGPLGDNLSEFKKKVHSDHGTTPGSPNEGAQAKKIIISDFRITNAVATVSLAQLVQKSTKLPEIRISEIGQKQGGVTVSEASEQITDEVVRVVAESQVQKLLGQVKSVLDKPEIPTQAKDLLKKLF
jgi:hypothetical protein